MSHSLKTWLARLNTPRVPQHLARRFRSLEPEGMSILEEALRHHYFTRPIWGEDVTPEAYLASQAGQKDMQDHLHGRLHVFRQQVIPWLDAAKPLAGASILEIGCGTGSSTVALAEQGAQVTAVDIDAPSLEVARQRCDLYGLKDVVEIQQVNATEVSQRFADRQYDFIIFFACLEHMIHEERMDAMRQTWEMLPSGALWCVIDTPNRLWYFDQHTAHLPFYFWLPDDLAFAYSRFSPRHPFNQSFREPSQDAMLGFLRHGRGVSYHEFDLTMKQAQELHVVSSLSLFLRAQQPLWDWGRRLTRSANYRYEKFLMEVGPSIHPGFYQPSLDLIIRKDDG